jgi:NADPH:quinone reductase-like Zn-dependent oxidoreductase
MQSATHERLRPETSMMRAARIHGRGGPEQIFYEDAPLPKIAEGDALVRVCATGITPAELTWDETYRNIDGSDRIPGIPGHEVCGKVEALGSGVMSLRVGEEVYGLSDFPRDGAAAEYIAVRAANLAPKPKNLDCVQAAAVPLSALTAWQALFDKAQLAPGQRVLIHGAAGGVGSFAVQLAHWRGAQVIATASARHIEFLRGLGADRVIDYTISRFEDEVKDIDVVVDTIGGETLARSWRVLRRGGVLVTLPAPPPAGMAEVLGVKGIFFIVEPNRQQLVEIGQLIDSGQLKIILAGVFSLARAREAFELAAAGHLRGKMVLQVCKE